MRLEAFDAIADVPGSITDDGECVIGHPLEHFVDGQYPGRITLLLIVCPACRDPVCDELLFLFMNGQLSGADFVIPLGAGAEIGTVAAIRFRRDLSGQVAVLLRIE
jgi:hypothetical protein